MTSINRTRRMPRTSKPTLTGEKEVNFKFSFLSKGVGQWNGEKLQNNEQVSASKDTPAESIHTIHFCLSPLVQPFLFFILTGSHIYSSVHEPCVIAIGSQCLLEECVHKPKVLALVLTARRGQQRVAERHDGSRAPHPQLPLPSCVLFCRQKLSIDARVP